ncbi:MAG TPA: hypothetical protein V6D18_06265 [Thermosynechococcaceae cyanobacterium]
MPRSQRALLTQGALQNQKGSDTIAHRCQSDREVPTKIAPTCHPAANVVHLPVQPPRANKIDLTGDYPCPCRRRGRLTPIALTEAFGCNRCQQIFVVDATGYVLEQLASHYPYKRAWHWTGHQWSLARSSLSESYLPVALGVTLVLLSIWLPLALNAPPNSGIILWAIVALLLAILPALMILLAYRR